MSTGQILIIFMALVILPQLIRIIDCLTIMLARLFTAAIMLGAAAVLLLTLITMHAKWI
jgi:hypothetical protein